MSRFNRNRLFIMGLLILPLALEAKSIKGFIKDLDNKPLQGIIVRLYGNNKIKSFTTSDKEGGYVITFDSVASPVRLTFSSKSYSPEEINLDDSELAKNEIDLPPLVMYPEAYNLQEVTVRAPHTRVKGDTIVYDVAAYSNQGDTNIEAVIKKLPGVEVTSSGQIMYEGEPINNFYIEGLNLMGNNYMVATQNISPKDVSSISIYERHQSKKALQGISPSQRAAINLKLKKGSMLKPVGYIEGGAGYGDETLWLGNIYAMLISSKNQTIVNAKGNNQGNVLKNYKNIAGRPGALFSNEPFGKPSLTTDRYLDNTSGYFTGNTLFKLKGDLTMTFNASYGLERGNFDEESETLYVNEGNGDIFYFENVGNKLKRQDVNMAAKIENNSNKLYLMDQIVFDGQFRGNTYGIFAAKEIEQGLKGESYSFSNDFSSVIRQGEHAYEIKSKTTLDRTPYIRMNSMIYEDLLDGSLQNVFSQHFHNEESTKLNRKIARYHQIGTDLKVSVDLYRFNTSGIRNNDRSENDLSGMEFNGSVSPFYTYIKPHRLQTTLTLPITYASRKFKDRLSGMSYKPGNIYVDLNFFVFLELNRKNRFNFNAGWKHSSGDIYSFATSPIFTTFRNSVTMGNGELVESLNKSVNLSYHFSDYLNSFYMGAMLLYSRIDSNSLNFSDIDHSSAATGSIKQNTSANTFYGSLTLTKRIMQWSSAISLSGNVMNMTQETFRNNGLIKSDNSTYRISADIETNLFNELVGVEAKVSYRISRQNFSGVISSSTFKDFSLEGKVSLFPFKQFEIYGYLMYGHDQIAAETYKDNLFIDAGAKYYFKKFTIELSARNLTGLKFYEYTIYSALDYHRYSYRLRPAEILISLKYNF